MTDQQPPAIPSPYVRSEDAAQTQQPAFAQQGFAPQPSRALSITSFALGLASVFFGFVFFIPIVGLVLGLMARTREPTGHGFATAGIWINAVMLGLVALGIVVIVLLVVFWSALAIPFFTTTTMMSA